MMIFLTLLAALLLSGIAEYYSVIGLASIFPGAFWPVIIMGATLGFAKIITTSWVYRNWSTAPRSLKYYLTSAIIILMFITSMGIFGYLSKAHLEHSADIAPVTTKIQLIDEKLKVAKENIDANRKAIKQMDEAVDQVMGRSSDEKGADKAVAIRKSQQKERARIQSEIEAEQKNITKLNEEKFPLQNELSKAESDFGPIKYVAELIYGSGEKDVIDKAVRLVIMLIMIVFDPLAVLLLIAGNMSIAQVRRNVEETPEEVEIHNEEDKPDAWIADVGEKPTEEEKKQIEEPIVEHKNSIEVPKDNILIIDGNYGDQIRKPTTNYDYDSNFSFRKKE